ncbi:zinc-dependent alcohol dehydrogenase family protein [Aeoliella sp. ICT_H6.2]|uniref:Zinc-dependent alcohol dehydrogenase family protein n=1 Tax=Aeoliella straminimaris TaxID=2954799 RepID=A0A9X2JJE9_9BACT|nr:zinc-dependent alcohol dehydrogenase family protein [Aeoliella straminimaris]MCO6047801.1 zinc-dependent alcohol dehydrogenase family protein [Aeoliella straminimaris]
MQAVTFSEFRGPISLSDVPEPECPADGAVIEVRATGLCRSDWHGWQGHDADIKDLPHVPGHEFAGVVAEVGCEVRHWKAGDQVTMPFVAGCGRCVECAAGHPQVCDDQFQPGFTAWGSFAQRVAVRYADFNLIRLPEELDFATAASLGCRMATSYRAVTAQGQLHPGEWVAVHGCGGVGLAAVAIAAALGGRPIAVDIRDKPLELARKLGAEHTLNAGEVDDVPAAIRQLTGRGADLSLDALGSRVTATNSILSLRKRGRHVQVGLLAGDQANPPLPMGPVVANELEIVGSHGLAARSYPELLDLVVTGRLPAAKLVTRTLALSQAPAALETLNDFGEVGVAVVTDLGS